MALAQAGDRFDLDRRQPFEMEHHDLPVRERQACTADHNCSRLCCSIAACSGSPRDHLRRRIAGLFAAATRRLATKLIAVLCAMR
jgi:hypothetical protein